MKRPLLSLILIFCLAICATAQEHRHYVLTCGSRTTNVDWILEQTGSNIKATIQTGSRMEYFLMDSSFNTLEYRVVDKTTDTDAKVTRSGNVYTFSGKNKGKSINRTEKSSGLPWLQNVEFNGVGVAEPGKPVKFECIRYTDMDRHTMQVVNKGETEVEGIKATRVRASLTGALSGVWGCDYYFDSKTGDFVVYKAVEGVPGTPETTIKPVK